MRSTYLAYGAQGLGYALLVSALPSFQSRHDLSADVISIVLLGVCVLAAIGSTLAGPLARRRGSSVVLVAGLGAEALGLAGAAVASDQLVFFLSIASYGLGLGLVDAGSAMRAIVLQHQRGRALLAGFFATYTAAALAGALLMAGALRLGGASPALLIGAVLATGIGVLVHRAPALRADVLQPDEALPRKHRPQVRTAGLLIAVAFLADAAISSWSSIYLTQLGLVAAAPLGYGLYQLIVLAVRLAGNRLLSRFPARHLGIVVMLTAAAGCALLATGVLALVFVGLALSALAVALLAPLAFTSATAGVSNADAVVARVNTYNYGGALLGAVGVGGVAILAGLGSAFLLPAFALGAAVPLARRLR